MNYGEALDRNAMDGQPKKVRGRQRRGEAAHGQTKRRRILGENVEKFAEPSLELSLETPGGREAFRYKVIAVSSVGRMRGVALLIREDIQLLESGTDTEGRIVWRRIKFQDEEMFVGSIYAPNEATDRVKIWQSLARSLPHGRWLLAGDWNSVVWAKDSSSRSNRQSTEEAEYFQNFCSSFTFLDAREMALKREGPSSDHFPLTATVLLEEAVEIDSSVRRSAYFKTDKIVVTENLEKIKEEWGRIEGENQRRPAAEVFLRCWTAIRRLIKRLQYEVRQAQGVTKVRETLAGADG
ncbi:hypothetical protein R1sor_025003 [Riccia sorocarpa]|uniref:Endonuclease/exonuclease/phosphatase domain-containing protein n=1 Tax=Riccia sorocarpa TaxID=122646 RepID=A0ABD3GAK7_9MARC